MNGQKILAVDWGEAVLGLAVSDDLGLIAHGLPSLRRRDEARDVAAIAEYARRLGIEAIVVGLPKNMDGSLGPSAEAAQAFAGVLRERLGLPVHLWDERLTTLAADRALLGAGLRRRARRAAVDQVAAMMILQGFLDRRQVGRMRGDG